jgi:UDP-glucose 4-epimerase
VPFNKEDVADQAMVSAIVKEYRIDAVLHFAVKKSGSPIRWRTR